MKKINQLTLFTLIIFSFLFSFSLINALDVSSDSNTDNVKGVNIQIPEAPINYSLIPTVNATNWWITSEGNLNDVSDIQHNWLSNLAWSVAGHTIDTDVDFDGNDLLDVDEAFFDGPVTIKQNGNTKLNIETETSTSYAAIELANPMGYDVILFMYGDDYAGTRYGFPMSNMTLLDTDTPDDLGVFVIGNYYYNPLSFVTDGIPRLNITADGDIEFSGLFSGVNISNLSNMYTYYADEIWINKINGNNFTLNESKFNSTLDTILEERFTSDLDIISE